MVVEAYSEAFDQLQPGGDFFLGPQRQTATVQAIDPFGAMFLMEIAGYSDRDAVEPLRNMELSLRFADTAPLAEGVYYRWEIIGLEAISDEGEQLGVVEQIIETGANDVYVVRTPTGEELLLPAIQQVVLKIDLQIGQMLIHLIPGLRQ